MSETLPETETRGGEEPQDWAVSAEARRRAAAVAELAKDFTGGEICPEDE